MSGTEKLRNVQFGPGRGGDARTDRSVRPYVRTARTCPTKSWAKLSVSLLRSAD